MPFFNNNFAGMSFDYAYSSTEENSFGGYSFGNERSDTAIAGPGGSNNWYLNPSSEGYADQVGYQGSTLLGVSGTSSWTRTRPTSPLLVSRIVFVIVIAGANADDRPRHEC